VNATAAFSPDYETARQRFRDSVSALGWKLESHPIGAGGPNAEQLTVDAAISPNQGAPQALVVSGGLHGVEGFFGSAVQLALLQRWSGWSELPIRFVLLHALNPFGFARLRRFDEKNVDLNRNFLLEGERYAGAPATYARLDRLLNPKRPPSAWEPFKLKALLAVARYGMAALKQAIAAGQYEFPQGLFYGGAGPSETNQLLARHLPRWLESARDVIHLDFHTGLGAWASYKLLIDYPLTDGQRARLTSWFGADSFEECDSEGIAYKPRGSIGQWLVAQNQQRDYLVVGAEFGTYGPGRVLGGLRAENQSHHWGQPTGWSTRRAKQRLRELFCPSSPAWREKVLEQSVRLLEKAVEGMLSPT
jgi:hypothetical protein